MRTTRRTRSTRRITRSTRSNNQNQKCIGIRSKTGQKHQVTSFGGKSVQKDKAEMKEIGHQAIKMIEEGSSFGEAKLEAERLMNL